MSRYILLFVLGSVVIFSTSLDAQVRDSIAIIGTGDLGDSVGPRLAEAGYRVVYGSRDPTRESVKALVARTGSGASATTQKEAAQDADIVLLAVPWPAMEQVAQNLGNLDGKIVIDPSFPSRQAEDGYMESMVETSSAEMVLAWNPGARVVKTGFSSAYVIDDPLTFGERITSFIASDDREAKEVVAKIIVAVGLVPLDAGPLRHAREIEAAVRLWYVPVLQGRTYEWEPSNRISNYWSCRWEDDWFDPVADADNLARIPHPAPRLEDCP